MDEPEYVTASTQAKLRCTWEHGNGWSRAYWRDSRDFRLSIEVYRSPRGRWSPYCCMEILRGPNGGPRSFSTRDAALLAAEEAWT